KKNPIAEDMRELTMPGAMPLEDEQAQSPEPQDHSDNAASLRERIQNQKTKHQQKLQDKVDIAAFYTAVETTGMFVNGATRAASKYIPSFPELPPELDRKNHDLPLMPGTLPEDVDGTKALLSTPNPTHSLADKAKQKAY